MMHTLNKIGNTIIYLYTFNYTLNRRVHTIEYITLDKIVHTI